MSYPTWAESAACYGGDPTPFDADNRWAERTAKAICNDEKNPCPVRLECLAYALRIEQGTPGALRFGVYGGLNGFERAELAKRGAA